MLLQKRPNIIKFDVQFISEASMFRASQFDLTQFDHNNCQLFFLPRIRYRKKCTTTTKSGGDYHIIHL
jgi:hypothetical protein